MNTSVQPTDATFDARVRALHDEALRQLSPRVQAQLAQRRRSASQGVAAARRRSLLPWAGMATAAIALALVIQLRPPSTGKEGASAQVAPQAQMQAVAGLQRGPAGDDDTLLSEDPEFYLWLAADGQPANVE